uniref:Uncharacterized protein n=1 Tax=symbiont bacterium of Paederus fuscipes TaxID=176282 RepID=Q6VT90_UNCXX|nr:hypothetical protein [symbiont bacterium of Paederus fuscipes]
MPRSGVDKGQHSTFDDANLRRQRWKVWGSLILSGLLLGLMLGRLFGPNSMPEEPPHLLTVSADGRGLALRFNRQAHVTAEQLNGALILHIAAQAAAQQGEWHWRKRPVRWRIQEQENGVLLSLVSTQPLLGHWQWSKVEPGWQLLVELQ